jgi:8-oxo-dGTP diphosphatase
MRAKQVFAHYQREEPLSDTFKYCPHCRTDLVLAKSGHRLRPTCPGCGFVQHRNPAPTVSILIVDDDQVLLGKRGGDPGKGTWSLPSGYVEYEDDFLITAVREAKEETGLDIEVRSIINVVSSFVSPGFHFLGIYVTAHVVGGELVAGDDLKAAGWFPVAGPLPEMGFEEDVLAIETVGKGFVGLPIDPSHAKFCSRDEELRIS